MHLSPSQEGWLGGLLPLGGLLAAPLAPLLLHQAGRRGTLLFSCLPMLAGWVCLTVPSLPLLYIGRLLTGLASSWVATAVPVYIGEVACPSLRGTLGALFQVRPYFVCQSLMISQCEYQNSGHGCGWIGGDGWNRYLPPLAKPGHHAPATALHLRHPGLVAAPLPCLALGEGQGGGGKEDSCLAQRLAARRCSSSKKPFEGATRAFSDILEAINR